MSTPRFTLPESVLLQLRRRRAARVSKQPHVAPDQEVPILSVADVLRRGAAEPDASAIARAFVAGMSQSEASAAAEHDAFLLDPGMGPMTYLLSDGRVLRDDRTWGGGGIAIEESWDAAISAIVCGAHKSGIADLLSLIPRIPDGSPCPTCEGTRWAVIPPDVRIVCPLCHGRGEVDADLLRRGEGWIPRR